MQNEETNQQFSNQDANISVGNDTNTNREFSDTQKRQMVEWAIEDGSLTQEKGNELLEQDGLETIKHDNRSVYEKEIDNLFPPAKPEDYQFDFLHELDQSNSTSEVKAVNDKYRSWLSHARFTKEQGSFIANEVNRSSKRWQQMSEPVREAYKEDQQNILKRMWGPNYNQNLNLALKLVKEMDQKSPGALALLEETGAANNAFVIQKLAAQAKRQLYRQTGK